MRIRNVREAIAKAEDLGRKGRALASMAENLVAAGVDHEMARAVAPTGGQHLADDWHPVLRKAYLEGWHGNTWRRRICGTNLCRVFILPDRLLAVRT